MSAEIEVTIKKGQLKSLERTLRNIPRAIPQILSRAINKTLTALRTHFVRLASAESKIKSKAIRGATSIRRATRRTLSGALRLRGGRIPLILLEAEETEEGVSYVPIKRAERINIPGAFITSIFGGEAVFKREGRARGPVHELLGPDIGTVFEHSAQLESDTNEKASERLVHFIDQEVKRLFEKERKRR